MVDPRLNSMHLELPRRQQFRRVREVILGARGHETFLAEQQDDLTHPPTAVLDKPPAELNGNVEVWLADRHYVYPLRIGLNTVGRAPDNDIVIQDGYVSRRHCTILVHTDLKVEVFDTASKNGTYINGKKMAAPTRLKPGDEIRMCDQNLVFMSRLPAENKASNTATLSD